MKILLIPALALVVLLGVFLFRSSSKTDITPSDMQTALDEDLTVEIVASFAIYTNGTKRIFTDSRYHNLSPDVFIEPPEVSMVIVKKPGVTWSDFFKTLPMSVEKTCLTTGTGQTFCTDNTFSLKFFVNNQSDPDALAKEIKPGDRLLISYGPVEDPGLEAQLESVPVVE